MKSLSLAHGEDAVLTAAAEQLNRGGVIIMPTETVYGLMTRYDNAMGRERIFALKQRPEEKQLQMLAADLNSALTAGVVPDPALDCLSTSLWPGPLTVVCRGVVEPTVGLRIPAFPALQELIRRVGFALAATSANRSGMPPATTVAEAIEHLDGMPDLVVDGGVIDGQASTVISILGSSPQVLRQGIIPLETVIEILGNKLG